MATTSREYLSSNSLVAYPFEEGTDRSVAGMFCDAVVHVPYGEPFSARVSEVMVSGGELSFRASLCGEDSSVSFVAEGHEGDYAVLRIGMSSVVVDVAGILGSEGLYAAGPFVLSVSCADFSPPQVSSFRIMEMVNGGDPRVVADGISGDVRLVGGSNVDVVEDDGSVRISASPGSGSGRVPCECDQSNDDIASTGSYILPERTGDVVIGGDGCIQVNADPEFGVISISGRCTACCPNEKYSDILERLHSLSVGLSDAVSSAMSFASDYNGSVSLFNAALEEPTDKELEASLTLSTPIPRERASEWSNQKVKGSHAKLVIGANIVNASRKIVHVSVAQPYRYVGESVDTDFKCLWLSVSRGIGATIPGDLPTRPVVIGPQEFDLPAGGSASVYSVLCSKENVASMPSGTYAVGQRIVFSWVGKELRNGSIVDVTKSVVRNPSATITTGAAQ